MRVFPQTLLLSSHITQPLLYYITGLAYPIFTQCRFNILLSLELPGPLHHFPVTVTSTFGVTTARQNPFNNFLEWSIVSGAFPQAPYLNQHPHSLRCITLGQVEFDVPKDDQVRSPLHRVKCNSTLSGVVWVLIGKGNVAFQMWH